MKTKKAPPAQATSPESTRRRFAAWIRSEGGSAVAAGRLGISRSYVDMIKNGQRSPGLRTAERIERATAGAILMKAWIEEAAEPHGDNPAF